MIDHAQNRFQDDRRRRAVAIPIALSREELLDAGEDVEHLLDTSDELDLSPACRVLLLDLNDALTRESARRAATVYRLSIAR